jgi:hypothetical protein
MAARTLGKGVELAPARLLGPNGMALAGRGVFASTGWPKMAKKDFVTEFDGVYVNGVEYLELAKKGRDDHLYLPFSVSFPHSQRCVGQHTHCTPLLGDVLWLDGLGVLLPR